MVWTIATLLLYLTAVYMILPRPVALLAAVTPVFVGQNILLGQNGFLTARLIGLSLVLLERRPSLSGIFLDLLTFKPHFGVLFPFVLLASQEWRAIGSAMVTGVTHAVISALAFGYQGWVAFFAALILLRHNDG